MAMIKVELLTPDAEAADIPEMRAMSEDGYCKWIDPELMWVDHHDILRATHGEYPLATTSNQVRMLIKYLEGVEARMKAASI